jgi:phospholipid/cholesterol/gamma-HCH transport system permease protein
MGSASVPAGASSKGAEQSEEAPPIVDRRGKTGFLEEMGEFVAFSGRAIRALPGAMRYSSEIIRLNAMITRRTSLLLFSLSVFFGFTVSNFGFFFLRAIGAGDLAGVLPGFLTPRFMSPQMYGYVFSGGVGCAVTAELGAARIGQEIDAYETEGVDPMQLLVGTRILATLLFVPLASGLAMFGSYAGSYLTLVIVLGSNTGTQLTQTFFGIFPSTSMFYCVITLFAVTLQCILVATFYGMRDNGSGPEAVGNAVARSLAVNLVLMILLIALAGLFFYAGSIKLPIGD